MSHFTTFFWLEIAKLRQVDTTKDAVILLDAYINFLAMENIDAVIQKYVGNTGIIIIILCFV